MLWHGRATGRLAALAVAVALALGVLTGCRPDLSGLRLVIATGGPGGVYQNLGNALATAWSAKLGMARPTVRPTDGSVANLDLLRNGGAQVAFTAADAAATPVAGGKHQLRALARIYDDYVQVMVRADSTIRHPGDMRGKRVSVGSPNSGVQLIAKRLLGEAGIAENQLDERSLGLDESMAALKSGRIDAFFWSGGLPTPGIAGLAGDLPLRMVDLSDVLPQIQRDYPVYETASVTPSVYGLHGGQVTTMVVPNFLLVTDAMTNDVAEALLGALFDDESDLVRSNAAARSIDVHEAIQTSPIELHPGALAYYRDNKI